MSPSKDRHGRRRLPVPAARSGARPPSRTCRTAATYSPGSARSRSSGAWCPPAGRPPPCAIRMVNSGSVVTATFADTRPESSATAAAPTSRECPAPRPRSPCVSPTPPDRPPAACCPPGASVDVIDGIEVTCVDNGMPVVVARAADLGITGYESHADLDADATLRERVERAPPRRGQTDGTRRRRRHDRAEDDPGRRSAGRRDDLHPDVHPVARAHTAIGVLGALSAATALLLPGGVGARARGALRERDRRRAPDRATCSSTSNSTRRAARRRC